MPPGVANVSSREATLTLPGGRLVLVESFLGQVGQEIGPHITDTHFVGPVVEYEAKEKKIARRNGFEEIPCNSCAPFR